MMQPFEESYVESGDALVRIHRAGQGPPLLMLHGFPQTLRAWYGVARILASQYTVILADLPGYGYSRGPSASLDHSAHSKRVMAGVFIELMHELGYQHFSVLGHDRGGCVAYRMALDHPERVQTLTVLNMIPMLDALRTLDHKRFMAQFHWALLAQPAPLPENLLSHDPDGFLMDYLSQRASRLELFSNKALSEYRACFDQERVRHNMCEEFRAAMKIDVQHDSEDDAAGMRIKAPMLVLWSAQLFDSLEIEPLEIWRFWGDDVTGMSVEASQFLMEERPIEVATRVASFLDHYY